MGLAFQVQGMVQELGSKHRLLPSCEHLESTFLQLYPKPLNSGFIHYTYYACKGSWGWVRDGGREKSSRTPCRQLQAKRHM